MISLNAPTDNYKSGFTQSLLGFTVAELLGELEDREFLLPMILTGNDYKWDAGHCPYIYSRHSSKTADVRWMQPALQAKLFLDSFELLHRMCCGFHARSIVAEFPKMNSANGHYRIVQRPCDEVSHLPVRAEFTLP